MKKRYWIIVLICALGIVLVLSFYISNPWNARRIGDIPAPKGYTRISADDNYTQFLRDLPLKRRGSLVHLHNGRLARLQFLSAAVLDLPILSRHEQCADVTMRIRAEYLWKTGQYEKISFISVSGKEQKYSGGESREKFESYLKSVYCHSNTESVFNETQTRNIKDVRRAIFWSTLHGTRACTGTPYLWPMSLATIPARLPFCASRGILRRGKRT